MIVCGKCSIQKIWRCSRLNVQFDGIPSHTSEPRPRIGLAGAFCLVFLRGLGFGFCPNLVQSGGLYDSGVPKKKSTTFPHIYLALRTHPATVPANTLSIGFSNPSLSSALATLQSLTVLTN